MNEALQILTDQLQQKISLLEDTCAKTKLMIRFAQEEKTTGLRRVTRERAVILEDLVSINASIAMGKSTLEENMKHVSIQSSIQRIKQLEIVLLKDNELLMTAAYAVRKVIMDSMRGLKEHKRLRNAYDLNEIKMAGRRVNRMG